jgi:hypothetical protein
VGTRAPALARLAQRPWEHCHRLSRLPKGQSSRSVSMLVQLPRRRSSGTLGQKGRGLVRWPRTFVGGPAGSSAHRARRRGGRRPTALSSIARMQTSASSPAVALSSSVLVGARGCWLSAVRGQVKCASSQPRQKAARSTLHAPPSRSLPRAGLQASLLPSRCRCARLSSGGGRCVESAEVADRMGWPIVNAKRSQAAKRKPSASRLPSLMLLSLVPLLPNLAGNGGCLETPAKVPCIVIRGPRIRIRTSTHASGLTSLNE